MCPACSAAWMRWLDYRLPPAPIRLITMGNRVQDVTAAQEARYQDWRDTVRSQQDAIKAGCTHEQDGA